MIRRRIMFGIEDGGGNDANCILLLHLDNNRTNSASSGIVVNQYNSLQFSTTYKKFGSHSLNCARAYYYLPNDVLNSVLINDYTIDYWVRVSNTNSFIPDFTFGVFSNLIHTVSCSCSSSGVRVKATGKNSSNNIISIDNTIPYTFSTDFVHIAVVKKSDTLKLFINGTMVLDTQYAIATLYDTTTSNANYIAGGVNEFGTGGAATTSNFLDEFRVSNMARWTKNFTPPTAAYGEIAEGGVDGNDANCITLLHFDNNATNSSSISQTWTKGLYVLYSSTIKKFGTYAMYDQYGSDTLERDPNPYGDFVNNSGVFYQYLSGDWTAECWFRVPSWTTGYMSYPFALHRSSDLYSYFEIGISDTTIQLRNSTTGTSNTFSQNYSVSTAINTWHHVAVVKKNNLINVYIDGIAKVTNVPWAYVPNSGWTNSAIGAYNFGYIDEFRFSNIARWTTNFTPPTAAYV